MVKRRVGPPPMKVFTKLSAKELDLAKEWFRNDVPPKEIAARLQRDKSTITRRLGFHAKPLIKQGRKPIVTEQQIERFEKRLDEMIEKANGEYQVTYEMVRRSLRLKCSIRTIADRMRARGVFLRPMREKPVLTEGDVAERLEFGRKYKDYPPDFWIGAIDMHMDVKFYKVCLDGRARSLIRRGRVKGALRKRGDGLKKGRTRPPKKYKINTGVRGVNVLAGVGQSSVILWEYLPRTWNAKVAADMYQGPVKEALRKAYPGRKTYKVLEDNDPVGFKSDLGVKAKAAARIKVFPIPKRSPCLNVCDFALWDEVNRRMQATEAAWHKSKKETRAEYLNRLKKTAMSLPKAVVQNMIKDLKPRCERLYDEGGGNIEEGMGKSQKNKTK